MNTSHSTPTFSIIIPVHNRAVIIHDCLDSVFSQSFQDFEVILVDNNSTDNLKEALSKYTDHRLRVTPCVTPGPSAARSHGVDLSRGKYLSFIDSDDVWRNDVLQVVFEQLESQSSPVAVYLSTVVFHTGTPLDWSSKQKGRTVLASNLLDALWKGAPGACALAGVQRELFTDGNGFHEGIWIGEDMDWTLRHAMAGPVSMLQDEPRLGYRRHDENITKDANRYEVWASQLLDFARSDRYETQGNTSLRKLIVGHLMGQIMTLLRMRRFAPCLRLYPRIFTLGVRWHIWRPLFLPAFFGAFYRKNVKTLSDSDSL